MELRKLIEGYRFNEIFDKVMLLKRYSAEEKTKAKGVGIYFLFKNNIITYIGISQCIYNRLFDGRTPHFGEKDFDSFSFINLNLCNRDLEFYEYELISLFKPKDNNQNRGFLNYEYLQTEYKCLKEDFDKSFAYKNALLMFNYF
jgi:hypothetical protein